MLGKPGSGKGTQSKILQDQLNYKLIKTGHYVRTLSEKNTKIAQELEKGGLVDNDLVNQYVASELEKDNFAGRIVTDGYPRDIDQAKWFDDYLGLRDKSVDKVILLELPDEVARERLLKRKRKDDETNIIKHRFDVYHTTTQLVIDYYLSQHKLSEIDATRTPVEISDSIRKIVL